MIEAGAGGRLHRSDRKSMTAAERGEGKGRGVGQGGRAGGWGGPVGSQGSVVGTVAVEITAYVDVLAPKLLCSRLLLRAAVV